MKRNDLRKKAISFLMVLLLGFESTAISATAAEEASGQVVPQEKYGRLPVYCMENGGSQLWLDVCVKEDHLYVKSTSFAGKFGYLTAETEDTVEFLQCANSEGEAYRWTILSDFKIGSDKVWISDGMQSIGYKAPFPAIKNSDGIWVPFQFALKMMGREMCVNEGIIMVSEPHEIPAFLINNVDRYHKELFEVFQYTNEKFSEYGLESDTEPLLTEAIASEDDKYEWLYSRIEDLPDSMEGSSDGLGELATYLVSNVSPENAAMYQMYFEQIQMYMSSDLMLAGADVAGSMLFEISEDIEASQANGKKIVEQSAAKVMRTSTPNIRYNDAFRKAYSGLTGYEPVEAVWENETIYDGLIDSLYTYSGDPDDTGYKTIAYVAGFLGPLGTIANQVGLFYVDFHCNWNTFAENDYASQKFENYITTAPGSSANSYLREELAERIDDYAAYEEELMQKYQEQAMADDLSGGVDGAIADKIAEYVWIAKYIKLGVDFAKYVKDMDKAALERLKKSDGAYEYSRCFANEIRWNALEAQNTDWAYCYYKTDFISYQYFLSVMASVYAAEESYAELNASLHEVMDEDTYHMAEIRSGISYGLKPEDNEDYNAIYDDTMLLDHIVEVNLSVGNTNGNMNAYGVAAATDEHVFLVDSEKNYHVFMSAANGSDRQEIIKKAAFWLNAIQSEKKDYLFYIDGSRDICMYDVSNGSSKVLAEGTFSRLMVAYGYAFAVEDGDLCRFDLVAMDELGDKTTLIRNVGDCVVYTDDAIYYGDKDQSVYKADLDGGNAQDLQIRSASFDISNGILYYSDLDDSRSIYMKNILTGVSSKTCGETDTYCIQYYAGMIYFKVDNHMDSGFLYSTIPFVDKPVTRVYTWEGEDNEFGVSLSKEIKTTFGRNDQRIYNIENGKIYNEGYLWKIGEYPLAGVNMNVAKGLIGYKISGLFHEE